MHDVSNIWRVPLMMQAQGAHDTICRLLGLGGAARIDMSQWKQKIADKWDSLVAPVCIAMVGKYTDLSDAYLSVTKALQHACMAANRKLRLEWVEASNLEEATRGEDAPAYEGEAPARRAKLQGSALGHRASASSAAREHAPGGPPSTHTHTRCPCRRVGQAAVGRRRAGARRVWRARGGGQDPGGQLRAHPRQALPGHLPGHADRGD
jgi:hypothetical protein